MSAGDRRHDRKMPTVFQSSMLPCIKLRYSFASQPLALHASTFDIDLYIYNCTSWYHSHDQREHFRADINTKHRHSRDFIYSKMEAFSLLYFFSVSLVRVSLHVHVHIKAGKLVHACASYVYMYS